MSDTTETTEAPALPGDGLRESIVDDLRRHIGAGLLEHLLKPQDDLWIRVSADAWADTGRAFRAMGFEYFCFLSAIDWKPSPFGRSEDDPTQPPPERKTEVVQGYAGGETRFQVFARVTDIRRHVAVTIKADVADDNLSIDSWHAIYAGANWHERETHEMFGIGFNGHPDLRNMYLPTEFEGYPLRKDFPLLARLVKPWPGIVDVEPLPAEDADGDGVADAAPPAEGTPEAAPETATDPSTVTDETAADAPAHETPAEDVAAEAAEVSPDTVVAEETAADVAPVAKEAAADVAAEPAGDVESVTGTAEQVEAAADAEANESRESDDAAAETAETVASDDEDGAS
jgi:NADH-quinone oxidoreductase subunit C